jgi:hypothetical protein
MLRTCFWILGMLSVLTATWAQLGTNNKPPVTSQEIITDLPVHVKGLSLNQIASCRVIDQLPWVFRKTNRQSRLIARDRLRLSTQSEFAIWEIHQVQDANGYVSYVFRRPMPGGRFESIVTKENYYNRIIDNNGSRKIVDVRNLMTLIDRPALTFYAKDGTYAVFMPGLAGKASFVITYPGGVAPVYLRGSSCQRMGADGSNPFEEKPAEAGAAPAAPGAAGGASGSSGGKKLK